MHIKNVITMLPVRDLQQSIAFYAYFGFEVESKRAGWGWAMLAAGGCRLMLDQSINRHPGEARDAVVYLYVDNVEAVHRMLHKAGIAVPEVEPTFYGMTEFRIDDPDGNRLWIGQLPSASTEPSHK